jgi:hypothetical protein
MKSKGTQMTRYTARAVTSYSGDGEREPSITVFCGSRQADRIADPEGVIEDMRPSIINDDWTFHGIDGEIAAVLLARRGFTVTGEWREGPPGEYTARVRRAR